ncbi:PREDICTED: protein-cysteine N-palmitoyltransferase HHAT-like protein [Nanorana parkeri]|uniref:protein-cysteine N-palmitoyltransferase HHAT-like protein n=1 Tax=Nanorana parkeri TaxID=125878 RepID=UPI000854E7EC|nr:PREDICTED: protein-cysteine N-palmitoyltransferase HHAT-like protein [Nanorana parkeri]
MGIKTALPHYELGFYALVLTCGLVYSMNGILEASRDNMNRKSFKENVKTGWYYFGRKMDVADFEWVMWFTTFRNYIIFALSGHVIFAKVFSLLIPQVRSLRLDCLQSDFVPGSFSLQDILFYGGAGFSILRCMSFALETCDRKEGFYSPIDLLKYNFYLPFFFFGPIMTFDQFYQQVNTKALTRRENDMWNIRVQAAVHVLVILLVNVFFHFLYILSIPSDLKCVKKMSDWSLAGLAYSNLVYDWVKAAVMFGVINTISRLDHLDPPQPPKCITMLYVFAETHFDRGINDWLCKYVYDYLGEGHDNIKKELLATVFTFLVTTLWLGPCDIVYIWSVFNCFGLNFELWVQKFFELSPFTKLEASLPESMSRRIRGIFGAANFWAIILYNILALNSLEFAILVAKRIIITGFPYSTLSIWFVTYCGVQLIKERERVQAIEAEKSEKLKTA